MKKRLENVAEMEVFAREFVAGLDPNVDRAAVVLLSGDLGAGKTAFVKGVAKAFGVKEEITSPTFVIEKIYKLTDQKFDHLIHIDAYRLESGKELLHLGWKEISENPKNVIFLEWPEKVDGIFEGKPIKISFEFIDENVRSIEM